MDIRQTIALARRLADEDPDLAIYTLRDCKETEAADMAELARCYSDPDYSGWTPVEEAVYIIDKIEAYVNANEGDLDGGNND